MRPSHPGAVYRGFGPRRPGAAAAPGAWARGMAVRAALIDCTPAEDAAGEQDKEEEADSEDERRRRGYADIVIDRGGGGSIFDMDDDRGSVPSREERRRMLFDDDDDRGSVPSREERRRMLFDDDDDRGALPSVAERRALLARACDGPIQSERDDSPFGRPVAAEGERSRREPEENDEAFGVNWSRMAQILGKEQAAELRAEKAKEAGESSQQFLASMQPAESTVTSGPSRLALAQRGSGNESSAGAAVTSPDHDAAPWIASVGSTATGARAGAGKEGNAAARKAAAPQSDFLTLMSAWTGDDDKADKQLQGRQGSVITTRKLPEVANAREKRPEKSLTRARIKEIRGQYPDSKAPAPPDEARHWTEFDLELFLGSDGVMRPRADWDRGTVVQTSPLLTDLRLHLAEERISKPPPEYISFCQYLAEQRGDWRRLPVARVMAVPRAKRAPELLKGPVHLEPRDRWKAKSWRMNWWAYEIGEEPLRCFRRYPPFPSEKQTPASCTNVQVDEFVKYVNTVGDMDPQCREDEALAYPRFFVGGWSPWMCNPIAEKMWKEDWSSGRQLWAPPGLKDLTERWADLFCRATGHDCAPILATLDRLQLGPAGAVTRLHVENNAAHAWYAQVQGRRVFILFAPKDGPNLYAKETGEPKQGSDERREYSPVDLLKPNLSRHPKFQNCTAHVAILAPGEFLVVPQGWWLYTVALEPSVTLVRKFWNRTNKAGVCDELLNCIKVDEMQDELRAHFEEIMEQFRAEVNDDHASDDDDSN